MKSVSGFLKILAWITLIGGIVGALVVASTTTYEGPYEGINIANFFGLWLGVSVMSIVWFAVLHGFGEIVEAAHHYTKSKK